MNKLIKKSKVCCLRVDVDIAPENIMELLSIFEKLHLKATFLLEYMQSNTIRAALL